MFLNELKPNVYPVCLLVTGREDTIRQKQDGGLTEEQARAPIVVHVC